MDHSVAAVDVVWGVEIATFSMNWRGQNLMVVGKNSERAFKQILRRNQHSDGETIWIPPNLSIDTKNDGFWNVSRFKYAYFGCPVVGWTGWSNGRLPSESSYFFSPLDLLKARFDKKCCQWEVFYFPTRWGPLTTISGFIPSYTHLQPWSNRVCWGYNYLITRGAPSCMVQLIPKMQHKHNHALIFFKYKSYAFFFRFSPFHVWLCVCPSQHF